MIVKPIRFLKLDTTGLILTLEILWVIAIFRYAKTIQSTPIPPPPPPPTFLQIKNPSRTISNTYVLHFMHFFLIQKSE